MIHHLGGSLTVVVIIINHGTTEFLNHLRNVNTTALCCLMFRIAGRRDRWVALSDAHAHAHAHAHHPADSDSADAKVLGGVRELKFPLGGRCLLT
jgi:hypothetical protein